MDPSVLQLARAGFTAARRTLLWEHLAQGAVVAAALVALFVEGTPAYLLSVLALLFQTSAWTLDHTASSMQTLAERARRRALLIDGLGETTEPLDVADLRRQFDGKLTDLAKREQTDGYYCSDRAPGPARLRDHLQESAFWSHHLYGLAARRALRLVLILFATILVAALISLPTASRDSALLLARVLVVLLASGVTANALARAMAWRDAEGKTGSVLARLEATDLADLEPCLATVSDYSVATSLAPPIPSRLYEKEKDRLNRLWCEFRGS